MSHIIVDLNKNVITNTCSSTIHTERYDINEDIPTCSEMNQLINKYNFIRDIKYNRVLTNLDFVINPTEAAVRFGKLLILQTMIICLKF
jgi:hypothetical protein